MAKDDRITQRCSSEDKAKWTLDAQRCGETLTDRIERLLNEGHSSDSVAPNLLGAEGVPHLLPTDVDQEDAARVMVGAEPVVSKVCPEEVARKAAEQIEMSPAATLLAVTGTRPAHAANCGCGVCRPPKVQP